MKFNNIKNIIPIAALTVASIGMTSCVGDLDVDPISPTVTLNFNQNAVFEKVYASLVLTGSTGPDGNGDINGIDEGTSDFTRQVWNANELTSDEAGCVWGDVGISSFNHNEWSSSHPMLQGLYYRLFFTITTANGFLDNTSTLTDAATVKERAEVRFIRALCYYYLMDMFGNVPIITTVSNGNPEQATRSQIFSFVESELKDIEGSLAAPRTNTYGRVDQAADWLLLARLYLNAEVYTGTAQWDNAATYALKTINSGYKLCTTAKNGYSAYQLLFMGDNDTNGAQDEDIFPLMLDGNTTQTWGNMLFLIASTHTGDEGSYGTTAAWSGNRCRKQVLQKFFPDVTKAPTDVTSKVVASANDDRALFFGKDRKPEMGDGESNFFNGFTCNKFSNVHADGTATKNVEKVDADYPFMRLAEAYLTYAEALTRKNNGTAPAEAVTRLKELRARAHAAVKDSWTLDDICDEWSREFWFEGRRRMDLVRFGKYAGQSAYTWEWMGGSQNGTQFASFRNIFAIPSSELNANSNLKQNEGY
jgi:hypothetical protein